MKSASAEITLAPLDNRALANLCGALDANLRQIEAALEVTICPPGCDLYLARRRRGKLEHTAAALQRFYAHAEEPLTVDDIQLGLVELATQNRSSATR